MVNRYPKDIDEYEDDLIAVRDALWTEHDLNSAVRTEKVNNTFEIVPQNVSRLRDILVADGSIVLQSNADVEVVNGEYRVRTEGSNGVNRQALETAEIGRYRSGAVSIAGVYARKETAPVGVAEWGYGRDGGNDQLFVRYKSDGSLEFVVKRGGVETVIPQSKWANSISGESIDNENGNLSGRIYGFDKFDGNGPSGINLDPAKGYIYRIDFSWYGGGAITLNIVTTGADGKQRAFPAVTFQTEEQVSIQQPNQPVFGRLDNNGDTTQDDLFIGGRQFSVLGGFEDEKRNTNHFIDDATVGTGETNLVAFRRKSGFEGIELELEVITVAPSANIITYAVVDPDLSSPTWSAPTRNQSGDKVSSDETAIEVTSASMTAGSGVQVGDIIRATGGGGSQKSSETSTSKVRIPVPRQKPIAVVAEALGGSSTTTDVIGMVSETW